MPSGVCPQSPLVDLRAASDASTQRLCVVHSSASGRRARRAVFWARGAGAWNKLRCSAAGVGRVTLGKGLLVVRCVGFWISKASSCRGSRSHRRREVRPPERQRPRLGRSGSGRGRRLGGEARGRRPHAWTCTNEVHMVHEGAAAMARRIHEVLSESKARGGGFEFTTT